MSQRSFGVVAVLAVRDCAPAMEGRSSSPRACTGMGSAPGGRQTLRSVQRTRGLAPCALRGGLISAIGG